MLLYRLKTHWLNVTSPRIQTLPSLYTFIITTRCHDLLVLYTVKFEQVRFVYMASVKVIYYNIYCTGFIISDCIVCQRIFYLSLLVLQTPLHKDHTCASVFFMIWDKHITVLSPWNEYPGKPHFIKRKMKFTGVKTDFLLIALTEIAGTH